MSSYLDSGTAHYRSPAPRTYWVEAIVLRVIPYGEKDRILAIYTRQKGKLNAIAKGSRNPLTRLASATQLFTHARYFLAQGRNFEVVTQARIIESFERLRRDVNLMVTCAQCCEMLMKSVPDGEPDEWLFDDLLSALRIANSGVSCEALLAAFTARLLMHLGYMPQFECCVRCGKAVGGTSHFSTEHGGTLCRACADVFGYDAILSNDAIKLMLRAIRYGLYEAAHSGALEKVSLEVSSLLTRFWQHHFQAQLQSLRVREQLCTHGGK
ncbi:MAG: DNA repair protein RecO [Armatimonadetes bacterium]|nr:DNA repair protein RecO [Armatimonadota bacterium]